MEQESFEDEETAALLNEYYISIKVDREERPDIDSVYMAVCQALTGSGGWPLTILMTPEQKPFYAGTYFPKHGRYQMPGLMELLNQIKDLWKNDRKRLEHSSREIIRFLKQQEGLAPGEEPGEEIVKRAAKQFQDSFDPVFGGFGSAPKFPVPHHLLFLMKQYEWTGEKKLLEMAEKTMVQMYRGGIFDQIGGGFSRYATDEAWLVPHFEKMLYDNALLAMVYLEGYRLTGKQLYLWVAEKTLEYVQRELTHDRGGFFCSQDADSEGVEGKFYVFTPKEVKEVLGEAEGNRFCQWFDITEEGNFEGRSIPNLLKNQAYETRPAEIEEGCQKLRAYRRQRTTAALDDKILTGWNGLGILAFAKAYEITGKTCWLKQAKKAAAFVRANLMTLNGKLKLRWRNGHVANEGQLDDYSAYGLALVAMYQADFDAGWLRTAVRLGKEMLELFEDGENGGFYLYGSHVPALISRPKEVYDGAMPSGNSMAGLFLEKLAGLTGAACWQRAAERQLRFLAGSCREYPSAHSAALLAIQEALHPGIHLVSLSQEDIPDEEIRIYRRRQKETVEALAVTGKNQKSLGRLSPNVLDYEIPKDGIVYYVCKDGGCLPPQTEL